MTRARTTLRRTVRRRTSPTARRDVPINVKFCVMGDGISPQCIRRGSTIAELFKQAGFDARASLRKGAVIRLDGRNVNASAVIRRNGAIITSTSAVKGGR
ncbi:hypothetical protein GTO27_03445 [Candidatus Bathyarchaeota archaeon]|nr:hypothetical protein [Candidatus Bathyarchaeota archaeon]